MTTASGARGDGTLDQKAAAQVIFEQGRALTEQGHFADACPKFAESERLDPGIGTMLWLADCYENTDQTASAWATFKEAAASAALRHDARERIARDRAVKLEPKLSRLTVVVPPEAAAQRLQVRRDGMVVGPAEWGVPVPLDPGVHTITADAPGFREWSTTVQIGRGAEVLPVTVPMLQEAPPAAAPVAPAATPTEPQRDVPAQLPIVPADHRGTAQRVVGVIVAGAGVAGIALGTVFSLKAKSTYDDSRPYCLPDNECDPAGKKDRSDAASLATVATVAMALGATAIAAGAVLYFTAPTGAPVQLALTPHPRGGAVRLAWSW